MNLTVYYRSRSKGRDYEWYSDSPANEKELEYVLARMEGSTSYALAILKTESGDCRIAMQAPVGKKDAHNRSIRLELWIEGISEEQARAFAVAYLDLKLEKDGTRNWPTALEAYKAVDDDTYTLDTSLLFHDIEDKINQFRPKLQMESPTKRFALSETSTKPGSLAEKVREHLLKFRLSTEAGTKILLNDAAATGKGKEDICLRVDMDSSENNTESWDIKTPQSPPPTADIPPCFQRPIEAAKIFLEKAKNQTPKLVVKTWKRSWLIAGILLLIGCLFFWGKTTQQEVLTIQAPEHCKIIINNSEYEANGMTIPLETKTDGFIILTVSGLTPKYSAILNGKVIHKIPEKGSTEKNVKIKVPATEGILRFQILPTSKHR